MILIDGYLDITIYIRIYIYACLQIIPIISYKVTGYCQRILLRFWNAFTKFTVPLKGECTRRCGQLKCRENDEKQWDLGGFL